MDKQKIQFKDLSNWLKALVIIASIITVVYGLTLIGAFINGFKYGLSI